MKKKGGHERKRDRAHAVHQDPVGVEDPGGGEAHDVGRQHRFAAGRGGEAAETQQDEKEKLDLRLAHPVAERAAHEPERGRDADRRQDSHRNEHGEQDTEAGEQGAQGEHGPEVGDEAGGEDQLAQLLAIETGLDHHRVDDRDGGGAEGDARDLRGVKRPVQKEVRHRRRAEKRKQEGNQADGETRLPVPAQ